MVVTVANKEKLKRDGENVGEGEKEKGRFVKRTRWVGAEGEGRGQDSRLLRGVVVFFFVVRFEDSGCWLLNEQAIYCQQDE